MAHTYSNLLVHAIFGRKGRLPTLDAELKSELFPFMGGIIRKFGGKPVLINGPRHHVHTLFVQPARMPLSDMLEKLKANSSRWIHQRWPRRRMFGWQDGYAAFQREPVELGPCEGLHRKARGASCETKSSRRIDRISRQERDCIRPTLCWAIGIDEGENRGGKPVLGGHPGHQNDRRYQTVRVARAQKKTFNPNWMLRGESAPVICPNVLSVTPVSTLPDPKNDG
jgi:REP element-mobilizing transposase RayT